MCFAALVQLFGLEALRPKMVEGGLKAFQDICFPDTLHGPGMHFKGFGDVLVIQPMRFQVSFEKDTGVREFAGRGRTGLEECLEMGTFLRGEVHRVFHALACT